jgi:polygalacturonase
MRKIVLLLLAVAMVATGAAKQKKKPTVEVWPDQTVMDAWFKDTTKVDVAKLGKQYMITDYGVRRDSAIVQTKAIQAVIDRAAQEGGGVVVIPEGTFLTGALFFKQGTHLHVIGKLKGSDRIIDFPYMTTRIEGETCTYFCALINADGLDAVRNTPLLYTIGEAAELDHPLVMYVDRDAQVKSLPDNAIGTLLYGGAEVRGPIIICQQDERGDCMRFNKLEDLTATYNEIDKHCNGLLIIKDEDDGKYDAYV